MTPGGRLILCGALLLATAAAAWGQDQNRNGLPQPLLAEPIDRPLSRHLEPPLSSEQMERFTQAQSLRNAGLLDRAREALLALLAERPHHPRVLTELASVYLTKQEFSAVERLARSERLSQRDSLLLGRELSLAFERMGRHREAVQTAIEVWSAEPVEVGWASVTLLRLATNDPRGSRDAMRRAVSRLPERLDLVRGMAQLEWRLGDIKTALRTLAAVEHDGSGPPLRWRFADELLLRRSARDTTGAIEALLDLAADTRRDAAARITAARRAWDLYHVGQNEAEGAPRLQRALKDLPPARWTPDLLAGVARGLRLAGLTHEARGLLEARGAGGALPPALALEQALADLRDGPPERALAALATAAATSPEAQYRFAEALFYSGLADSALRVYEGIVKNPQHPYAGAAFERIYLIEDARPREALVSFGRVAYEEWRGQPRRALALSESLYVALPRGPLWAQAALSVSQRREAAGDYRGALAPLLVLADSLPSDRLAPVARHRAGDLYLERLKDDRAALAQYEECLARYPRSWNAPEVRRKLESLRRARRF